MQAAQGLRITGGDGGEEGGEDEEVGDRAEMEPSAAAALALEFPLYPIMISVGVGVFFDVV